MSLPKVSEAFPSKYLRAADILGKRVRVKIERVEWEEMQDGKYKYVLYFENKTQGAVLNVTNATTLQQEYGDDPNEWPGNSIVLSTWKTKNPQGKVVDGILVNVLSSGPAMKAALTKPAVKSFNDAETENHAAGLDDDIPF